MSGWPLYFLLRSSAANLANTNCTAGTMRSIAASFVKTASGDIDDSRDMKGAPHSRCCQIAGSRPTRTGPPRACVNDRYGADFGVKRERVKLSAVDFVSSPAGKWWGWVGRTAGRATSAHA